MRVDEVMSEDPAFVDWKAGAREATKELHRHCVHHLPVLRDGVFVGMVSDHELRGRALETDLPVAQVMKVAVATSIAAPILPMWSTR